jgi:hypothetical protein
LVSVLSHEKDLIIVCLSELLSLIWTCEIIIEDIEDGSPLRRAGQTSARGPFNSPEYELHHTSVSLDYSSGGLSPRLRAPSHPPGDFDQAGTRSVCSGIDVRVPYRSLGPG